MAHSKSPILPPNANGRVYPAHVLKKAVKEFNAKTGKVQSSTPNEANKGKKLTSSYEALDFEAAKKAYGLTPGSETKIIRALVEDFTGAKKVLNMAFSPQVTADLHAVHGVSHAEILAETLADTLLHESSYGSPGWFSVAFQMQGSAKKYTVPGEFGTIHDAIAAMLKDEQVYGVEKKVYKVPQEYPTVTDACAALWMAGAWDAAIVVDTGGTITSFTYEGAANVCGLASPENKVKAEAAWKAAFEALPAVKAKAKAEQFGHLMEQMKKAEPELAKNTKKDADPVLWTDAQSYAALAEVLEKAKKDLDAKVNKALVRGSAKKSEDGTLLTVDSVDPGALSENIELVMEHDGTLHATYTPHLPADHVEVQPIITATQKPMQAGGIPQIDLAIKTIEIDASKKVLTLGSDPSKKGAPLCKLDGPVGTTPPDGEPFFVQHPLIPDLIFGPVYSFSQAQHRAEKYTKMWAKLGTKKAFRAYVEMKETYGIEISESEAHLLAITHGEIKKQLVSRIVGHAIISNMNETVKKAMKGYVFSPHAPYVPLYTTSPLKELAGKKMVAEAPPGLVLAAKKGPKEVPGFVGVDFAAMESKIAAEMGLPSEAIAGMLQSTAAHVKDPEAKKKFKEDLFGLAYGMVPKTPSIPVEKLIAVQPLPEASALSAWFEKIKKHVTSAQGVPAGQLGWTEKDKKTAVQNLLKNLEAGKLTFPAINAPFPKTDLAEILTLDSVSDPGYGESLLSKLTPKGIETLHRFGVKLKIGKAG